MSHGLTFSSWLNNLRKEIDVFGQNQNNGTDVATLPFSSNQDSSRADVLSSRGNGVVSNGPKVDTNPAVYRV